MQNWNTETTDKFDRSFGKYEKKHPEELKFVLDNLDTYHGTLNALGHPLNIKAGFIHSHYPKGIKSIDQKGGQQKTKLRQTRLYIFPDCSTKILWHLIIGDKNSQKQDIKFCVGFVKKLTKKGR